MVNKMYRFITLSLLTLFSALAPASAAPQPALWTHDARVADGIAHCLVSQSKGGFESGHVHFLWTQPRRGAPYWKAAIGIIPEYVQLPVMAAHDRLSDYQEVVVGGRTFAARDRAFSGEEAGEIIARLKRAQSFSYAFEGFAWRDAEQLRVGNFVAAIKSCEQAAR